MNSSIWKELIELERTGQPAVLITVIRTEGSTPREVGAKMIVREDGSIVGTIGGSMVEALVIQAARQALQDNQARLVKHTLNDPQQSTTGMICGGWMEFFIEPLASYPQLYIFGAGHVGLALTRCAQELGFSQHIFDDRAEFNTIERFPQAVERQVGPYTDLLKTSVLVQPAYVVIVTRCHDTDLDVLRGVLGKPYAYLGVICSRKKKMELFKILREEGFQQDELDRLHAPIGLDIHSDTPAEIAISILAEIIKIKAEPKE